MKNRQLDIPDDWKEKTPEFLYPVVNPKKALRFINYDSALNLLPKNQSFSMKKVKRLLQIRITCSIYKSFR